MLDELIYQIKIVKKCKKKHDNYMNKFSFQIKPDGKNKTLATIETEYQQEVKKLENMFNGYFAGVDNND
jgi:beta-glucosidase/6-phospho-beta-glucosidase/beta-galactosidase